MEEYLLPKKRSKIFVNFDQIKVPWTVLSLQNLLRSLYAREGFKRISINVFWLFVDKVIRMGVGLVVGAWVARYLGPSQFGLLNFAIAFSALFGAFATLGLDPIVVREILKCPEKTNELLGTTFVLKLLGGTFAFILSVIGVFLLRPSELLTIILVALSAGGFIFQAFLAIDFYYQAYLKSKYTVWAQNLAFLIISGFKVFFIFKKAPLIVFGIAGFAEILLGSILLFIFYKIQRGNEGKWKFSYAIAGSLLKDSWPLMLAGLAVMVYMRINLVMLGQMLNDRAVGIYSAATRISEIWYFIPMAIASSLFPAILKSKGISESLYYKRLQQYFTLMTWLGLSFALLISFSSKFIIYALYGSSYYEAYSVLIIHAWAGVFVCLGVASSSWFLVENLQQYSFYRSLMGALINIVLGLWLIPILGVNGASWATVLSYAVAAYLSDITHDKTRIIFVLKSKSLFCPFSIFGERRQDIERSTSVG
ncbi:MAG: flippase [Thermosphaera sp.]